MTNSLCLLIACNYLQRTCHSTIQVLPKYRHVLCILEYPKSVYASQNLCLMHLAMHVELTLLLMHMAVVVLHS